MPTMKDIAKAAGVSQGTVSNVLNKKGCVSIEKIRLVEQAAKALGYRIDEQASRLRKGTSRTVAIIMPNIESSKYADMYMGIVSALESFGYSLRLSLTNDMPYKEKQAIEDAIAEKTCAILTVTCLSDPENYYKSPALKKTVVLFLDRCPNDGSCYFTFDYKLAAGMIGKRIAGLKKDKVKIITGNLQFDENNRFKAGLIEALPDLTESNFVEIPFNETSTEIYSLFSGKQAVEIFITANEQFAQQLMNVYHTIGKSQPPTIITLAPLRTVQDNRFENLALNYRKMGYAAAESILKHMTEKAQISSTVIKPSGFKYFSRQVAPTGEKTLRIISLNSPSAEALKCLSPNFTRHTGVKLEFKTYPRSSIYEHILSEDEHWDVIRLDVFSLSYLAPKLCYPLDLIDTDIESKFNSFLTGLHGNYGKVGDKTYALPFDVSVQMLFYRRDLFEDIKQIRSYYEKYKKTLVVPATYGEYNDVACFFTRLFNPDSPTLYGSSIALGTPGSAASEYLPRLLSMGGQIYGKNGLLRLSTPEAKAALENYIRTARYSDPHAVHSEGEIVDSFIRGNTAMTILYVHHAFRIVQAQDSEIAGIVGFAPVPGKKPLLGGGSLCVGKHSKNIDEAYRFICWATSNQIASELMMMGGISPCREAYEQQKIIDTYPWLAELEQNIQLGCRKTILSQQDFRLDQRGFEYRLGKLIIDAITGKKELDETLLEAQYIIDQMEKDMIHGGKIVAEE